MEQFPQLNDDEENAPPPVVTQRSGKGPMLLQSGLGFVLEVAKTVLVAVVIIVVVRTFVVKPFYVKGASMEPTFHDNEYLIINEFDYRFREPARGDIIVLRYPRDPSQFFIKRIVGLPGERVSIDAQGVRVFNDTKPNGALLEESAYLPDNVQTFGGEPVALDPDEYFVLGDNRASSLDSRSTVLGPVQRSAIIGRVWVRVWPFSKIQAFPTPGYSNP